MRNLIAGEWVRLWKSGIFRLALIFSVGFPCVMVGCRWWTVMKYGDFYEIDSESRNVDSLLFVGGFYMVFALAILVGIFVGTEYANGTIRNKILAGHSRGKIYLAESAVCLGGYAILYVLCILTTLGLGNLFLENSRYRASEFLTLLGIGVLASAAMTSLLMLLALLIRNRSFGSVACLVTVLVMLSLFMSIDQRLSQPEYIPTAAVLQEDGTVLETDMEPNLYYVRGVKRSVYEFFDEALPISTLYYIVTDDTGENRHLGRRTAYSLLWILACPAAGAFLFRRKKLF